MPLPDLGLHAASLRRPLMRLSAPNRPRKRSLHNLLSSIRPVTDGHIRRITSTPIGRVLYETINWLLFVAVGYFFGEA
jgi:hypothetical protein